MNSFELWFHLLRSVMSLGLSPGSTYVCTVLKISVPSVHTVKMYRWSGGKAVCIYWKSCVNMQ